jgi:hypothetical protein
MMPKPEWLDVAARRSARHPWTLGSTFDQYCGIEQVSREQVADLLGCSIDALAWLALCRRPAADHFSDDLSTICDRFEIDPFKLAEIIRRVDVLSALREPTISREDEERMLLAARDRESDEREEQ